ncbi:MAG TPA: Uma2 family endonuclease [Kofleriaceae bacterium]|jgi:Uma2 family endonuclease
MEPRPEEIVEVASATPQPSPQRARPPVAPDNVRGLYRVEYEKLVELGLFNDQRVELLDGQLVEMSPQSDAHSAIVRCLGRIFYDVRPHELDISLHSGLRAGMKSMPEPDIAVIPRRSGRHHADEALLVVEVALSSLRNDRLIKSDIYAALGVPEYWIVDVEHELVIVHTRPTVRGYQVIEQHERGATLRTSALPMLVVTVDDILDCP